MSAATVNLPLGIAAGVLTIPSFLTTAFVASWRRNAGYPLSLPEKAHVFLDTTIGIVVFSFIACITVVCTGIATFFLVALPVQVVLFERRYLDWNAAPWIAAIVALLAGATVFFMLARVMVLSIWYDQREEIAALQASDAAAEAACTE
jgi:hypothetical protein